MDRTTDVRKPTALTKVAGTAATVPRVATREGGGGGGEAQGPTVRRCPDGSPAVVEVDLPSWVTEGPGAWRETMRTGSHGLTDKVNAYFFLYHLYLAKLVRRKLSCGVTNRHIKMLEVGLGCHPSGGMLQGKPGGSALGFRYLFDLLQHTGLTFELHTMEYDAACAHQFAIDHPGVTHIHTGDASSVDDLHRVVQDSGGEPFDIILDDASHINWHMIKTMETLLPQHLKKGGVYFVEDMGASCQDWSANIGVGKGERTGGTPDCMTTHDGKDTIFAVLVRYAKNLMQGRGGGALHKDVFHIDFHGPVVILEKALYLNTDDK